MSTAPSAAGEDVPRHLLTAVHAATTAVAEARRSRLEAEQSERDVTGLAFLAMRQLGFSDHYIARELGHPKTQLRADASYRPTSRTPPPQPPDPNPSSSARYTASTGIESETITSRRDVIMTNNIDDIEYLCP